MGISLMSAECFGFNAISIPCMQESAHYFNYRLSGCVCI